MINVLLSRLPNLFWRLCLDVLWEDPVGWGDHLRNSLDLFVLLTGEPEQDVLLAVLGPQELTEGDLSRWGGRRDEEKHSERLLGHFAHKQTCESHLYNWGLCPPTHSKSQHPPVDLWGSNTIYPWKEHRELSLAQLPVGCMTRGCLRSAPASPIQRSPKIPKEKTPNKTPSQLMHRKKWDKIEVSKFNSTCQVGELPVAIRRRDLQWVETSLAFSTWRPSPVALLQKRSPLLPKTTTNHSLYRHLLVLEQGRQR